MSALGAHSRVDAYLFALGNNVCGLFQFVVIGTANWFWKMHRVRHIIFDLGFADIYRQNKYGRPLTADRSLTCHNR